MNQHTPLHILLADDDEDDTFLFREALEQIPVSTNLIISENGMELMHALEEFQDSQSAANALLAQAEAGLKEAVADQIIS